MNIVLLDDDPKFNEHFKKVIGNLRFSYSFFSNYESFKKYLDEGMFVDILLLDIEMPNHNGFDIAKELKYSHPNICIFYLTNHDALVYDAFESNIFGFFRKSLIESQKNLIINKIMKVYNDHAYLIVTHKNLNKKILFSNISYFEKIDKNVFLTTIDNKQHKLNFSSLNELIPYLNSSLFIYINRSVIININQVESLNKIKKTLYLRNNNKEFYISRGRFSEVKKIISL